MFKHSQQTLRGLAVSLALLFPGYALADNQSDVLPETQLVAGTTNNAHRDLVPDANSDDSDVLEEIVVTGGKKNRRSKRDHELRDDLAITQPSVLEWQLFPAYDPERALQHFGGHPLEDQIQRVGIVEVFRIGFGR